ncbi:MAG: putative lipid II flippase FtsW [Chloroflexota bacterium]|nr:putative lipid II flippase FtsW [Chloroflexota bacterium]
MCIGILMVYSASMATAYADYGTPYYFAEREIIWAGAGLAAMGIAARISYHRWQQLALPIMGFTLLALVLVLIPHLGHMSHGARRWFSVGSGIEIQPSELVKLALVIYMASWLTTKGERVRDFKATFVPFSMIVGLVALLIIKEPDLGTAIVIVVTMFAVLFVAGANPLHMLLVSGGAVSFVWMLIHTAGYRSGRLTAFIDPWKHPTGVGYHTIQALLALGSGGIFGLGLGNSVQKYVLPAPHTDSILAVIGEEWGIVGTVVVLLLFMAIAYRGVRIALTAPDNFGKLLAIGITSWITFQALLNYAVITSSVPFTGVPLPFISYGGTSLILSMAAIGILLNISRHTAGEALARNNPDHGRGERRSRVSRAGDRAAPAPIIELSSARAGQGELPSGQ